LRVRGCPWLIHALTNLLFGLCGSLRIIDPLVIHPSPHPKAQARPSTLEVLQTREHTPTPYPSDVFIFGLIFESIKEFGGASTIFTNHFQNI